MNCTNCGGRLAPGVKFCTHCGALAPAPSAGPHAHGYATPPSGQMHSSFGGPQGAPPRGKSRAGKILLIVLCVLLVLGAGAAVAVYFGYRFIDRTVRESEPYRLAVDELRRSPAAAEHLGEIRETGFPLGSFKERTGGAGETGFTMSVEGTKGSGRYEVALLREGGVWRLTHATLRMADGKVVNVASGGPAPVGGNTAGPPPPPRPGTAAALSGGALDSQALSKPAPPYPALAKAARAGGSVTVQVTVDEAGRVAEARAVTGHPLLQQAAVQAARQARFAPTLRDGRRVRVSGTLTYDFTPE